MSRIKTILRGVGGLGYALTQFGVAVALTTAEAVAEGVRQIRRELRLERETEEVGRVLQAIKLAREYEASQRELRQTEALERVVARTPKLCCECHEPLDAFTSSVATCHAVCPHVRRRFAHRPGCPPWCGHKYADNDVPLLWHAPSNATSWKESSVDYGWFTPDGTNPAVVWCSELCRAEQRFANPTAPGAAAKS